MPERPRILIIDDQLGDPNDPMILDRYGKLHYTWLYETTRDEQGEYTVAKALDRVEKEEKSLDLILLDIMFGPSVPRLGIDILDCLRTKYPTLPIVMFTSLASVDNRELVIKCMELGANEFVEKMPCAAHLDSILRVYTDPDSDHVMYGNSPAIRQLRAHVARVSFSGETSVLTVGESGTGKELVARALHRQGPRKGGPFVAKNCANAESELLESELFGHDKGAFTGAISQRVGLIEEANGGVLFLDEVSDMPRKLQAKLLRTLETRQFRRLGSSMDLSSQFQLICASNRPTGELINAGLLRQDFYFRISTMTLTVPPLQERSEDVEALAKLFLRRFRARGGASYPGEILSKEFISALRDYVWPGNVRELRNTIERSVILSQRKVIGPQELPEQFLERSPQTTIRRSGDRPSYYGDSCLDDDIAQWPVDRVTAELQLAVEAKHRIQSYKGSQWKAEFMRLMYPGCKTANAKAFEDLIKRLTQSPWGCPNWQDFPGLVTLIKSLQD